MTNLTYETKFNYEEEDGRASHTRTIMLDGVSIGRIDYLHETEEDECYIEWVGIDAEFQGMGYGSQALNSIAKDFWMTYLAPMDEDNRRCYERIGEEVTGTDEKFEGVDQGYGVYELNK